MPCTLHSFYQHAPNCTHDLYLQYDLCQFFHVNDSYCQVHKPRNSDSSFSPAHSHSPTHIPIPIFPHAFPQSSTWVESPWSALQFTLHCSRSDLCGEHMGTWSIPFKNLSMIWDSSHNQQGLPTLVPSIHPCLSLCHRSPRCLLHSRVGLLLKGHILRLLPSRHYLHICSSMST